MKDRQKTFTILMADDDEDDCIIAREALETSRAPGRLQSVEDGIELLDYLYRRDSYEDEVLAPVPALILLDLNMPRKDGREALKDIRADSSFQHIPIVILTTSSDEKDIQYSYSMGADSFITKPSEFREWVEMMESLVEQWIEVEHPQ